MTEIEIQVLMQSLPPHVGALTVVQFCQWSGISRAMFYLEVKAERIRPTKVGRRTIVPVPEAIRWMICLPGMH